MTFGSLFAGIGGIDLGLERAGMRCVWQVEINDYCRKVLAKHWPEVPKWDDVNTFTGEGFEKPDLICGGFPCQDISNAGGRAGIGGEKSGLWAEYSRIIRTIRPRFVLVENVSALLIRGIDRVLGDLAACGYGAEWDCIPAAAVGAPHRRDRLFIVAHAESDGWPIGGAGHEGRNDSATGGERVRPQSGGDYSSGSAAAIADAAGIGRGQGRARGSDSSGAWEQQQALQHAVFAGLEGHVRGVMAIAEQRRRDSDASGSGWWAVEPELGRVANGVPDRIHRLKGLGNAVVPQVAEWIGRRLMDTNRGEA